MRGDESRTYLNNTETVLKDDVRIALYGELDAMQAEVICTQVALKGDAELYGDLQQVLDLLRNMMRALVLEEPLGPILLFGYDADGLREASHHVRQHFGIGHLTPDAAMGEALALLNKLRACARTLERTAVKCLKEGGRQDILCAANRLSSAFYILMCRQMACR